ncbi:hypothetical protein K445DRAFT_318498 [Daldinia sp. EC12]|nr:hypothetical protein K445DRAFT_318498 [Daldinia sp. EC12]
MTLYVFFSRVDTVVFGSVWCYLPYCLADLVGTYTYLSTGNYLYAVILVIPVIPRD